MYRRANRRDGNVSRQRCSIGGDVGVRRERVRHRPPFLLANVVDARATRRRHARRRRRVRFVTHHRDGRDRRAGSNGDDGDQRVLCGDAELAVERGELEDPLERRGRRRRRGFGRRRGRRRRRRRRDDAVAIDARFRFSTRAVAVRSVIRLGVRGGSRSTSLAPRGTRAPLAPIGPHAIFSLRAVVEQRAPANVGGGAL